MTSSRDAPQQSFRYLDRPCCAESSEASAWPLGDKAGERAAHQGHTCIHRAAQGHTTMPAFFCASVPPLFLMFARNCALPAAALTAPAPFFIARGRAHVCRLTTCLHRAPRASSFAVEKLPQVPTPVHQEKVTLAEAGHW
eukprot:6173733-Pleurochrysis_carterae.AAC.2